MNNVPEVKVSASYFWNCITLSDDCPFFSLSDPGLHYFGVGLMLIYAVFLLTILADLNFHWTIDNFQQQINACVNFVKKKLCHIEADQRKLFSIQERTEKQISRSMECTKIVTALRGALMSDDPYQMEALTENTDENFDTIEFID